MEPESSHEPTASDRLKTSGQPVEELTTDRNRGDSIWIEHAPFSAGGSKRKPVAGYSKRLEVNKSE